MPNETLAQDLRSGLWQNNVGLVQLLGLCPLLAVSTNALNAMTLGLASLLALLATSTSISALRHFIADEVRIPAFVTLIAAIVTSIELAMHAWLPELHRVLGIFLPLIVTNCAVLGRAEAKAARVDVARAATDALGMGLGFLWLLLLLGGLREVLGQGTLFAGAGNLLGWPALELNLGQHRWLLMSLPPGAFFLLGLLVALRQKWQAHQVTAPSASISKDRPHA
ncbi:MAG: electron transport complex subunit RsxE [Lysobacteraceae bacterium]